MSRTTVDPSLPLPDRAAAVLGAQFSQHLPGERDGWLVVPHYGCWSAVWDLAEKEAVEPPEQAAKRLEKLAKALTGAGYVVTRPPNADRVFFADRPHDAPGPRHTVVTNGLVLGGLIGGPHVVVDTWTNVGVDSFRESAAAYERCAQLIREQALTDAAASTGRGMDVYLKHADELLGDGHWFLRTEEYSITDHRPPTAHERIDALVDVANALRRGDDIDRTGRRVAYGELSVEYEVAWCAKSSAPAVGYFPGLNHEHTPSVDTAIGLLLDAGLVPAIFGESVGKGTLMVEQDGFQVGTAPVASTGSPRIWLTVAGCSAVVQHVRAVDVLREAGWTVNPSGFDDETAHEAFPPPGTVSPRREGAALGYLPVEGNENVLAAVSVLLAAGFNPAETADCRTVDTHGRALEYDELANGFLVRPSGDDHVTVQFLIDGDYRVGKTTDAELHRYHRALTAVGFLGTYTDGYFQIYARRLVGQEATDVGTIWEVLNEAGHKRDSLHLEGLRIRGRWYTGSVVVGVAGEMGPEERQKRLARIGEDLATAGGEPAALSPHRLRVEVSPEAWEVPAGIGCNVVDHEHPMIRAALMTLEGNGWFGGIFNDEVTDDSWSPSGAHFFPIGGGKLIVTAERDQHTGDPWAREVVEKHWEAHQRYARIFEAAGWTVRLLGRPDETGGTLSVRAPGY
ncbi:hypothetical protein [Streptomyces decoyicus]